MTTLYIATTMDSGRGSKRTNPSNGQDSSSETNQNPLKRKQPPQKPQNATEWARATIRDGYAAREAAREERSRKNKGLRKAKVQTSGKKTGNRNAANTPKANRAPGVLEDDSEIDEEMGGTGADTSPDLVLTGDSERETNALTGLALMSLEKSKTLTSTRATIKIWDADSDEEYPDLLPSFMLPKTSNTTDATLAKREQGTRNDEHFDGRLDQ